MWAKNLADWAQVALSLVVMLTGLYLALVSPRGRSLLATTRLAWVLRYWA